MGTFDELAVGERFPTPARTLDPTAVQALIGHGGYTHPLFTDPAFARASPFGRRPLPGQALLLVMGGLVEQSGRLDDTVIALVGFDDVRFLAPAFEDDAVHVEVEVRAKEERPGDRGLVTFGWRCVNGSGDPLCDATADLLFRLDREAT